MSVIIDEFEVVLDSQQDREADNRATESQAASAGNVMKPHDVAAIFEQQQLRCERVRAH